MSKPVEVIVLVEGRTEQVFVEKILSPYLARKKVYITAIILTKPGEKGGDVKFARAKNDIEIHLKQRKDTWLTMLVDYYGIRGDWPGYADSKAASTHTRKAETMNEATRQQVNEFFSDHGSARRFIPYVSMFEFEALLFSDTKILAKKLSTKEKTIQKVLTDCGEAENINDSPQTAPSKRLKELSDRFKKTSTGIEIASEIGIDKIREACPLFDAWLVKLEELSH